MVAVPQNSSALKVGRSLAAPPRSASRPALGALRFRRRGRQSGPELVAGMIGAAVVALLVCRPTPTTRPIADGLFGRLSDVAVYGCGRHGRCSAARVAPDQVEALDRHRPIPNARSVLASCPSNRRSPCKRAPNQSAEPRRVAGGGRAVIQRSLLWWPLRRHRGDDGRRGGAGPSGTPQVGTRQRRPVRPRTAETGPTGHERACSSHERARKSSWTLAHCRRVPQHFSPCPAPPRPSRSHRRPRP
jgi:hypothetical protein